MEYFIDNIESKTYCGRKFELQCSLMNVRHINFYGNASSSKDFMPAAILKQAFYRTMTLFPWLAGYLEQTSNGGFKVVVDKDNLNMPIFRESQSDVHFSDLSSAEFDPSKWPKNLVPVSEIACPDKDTGVIKLVNIHIVRLKDNSGVIISNNFNHGVADGGSCLMFHNRWAEEARALLSGVPAAETSFCFGSQVLMKHLPTERTQLSDTACKVYSVKSRVADFLMWLSPSARGKILNSISSKTPAKGHLFRISRAKVSELRDQALEHVPAGTHLSVNDTVSAILAKVHEQAEAEVAMANRGWLAKLTGGANGATGEHCIIVACDLRGRLGMAEMNYTGNPLSSEFIVSPMDQAHLPVTPQTVAVTADKVRNIVAGLTPSYIGQLVETLDSDDIYTSNYLAVSLHYKLTTTVSNLLKADMYIGDFGSGIQAFSTVHPEFNLRTFMIIPSPPPCSDLLVNICVAPPVMDCILKNKFWTQFAELVY